MGGTNGGGLSKYRGSTIEQYTLAQGLSNNNMNCLRKIAMEIYGLVPGVMGLTGMMARPLRTFLLRKD
jgi:hypothetical protein